MMIALGRTANRISMNGKYIGVLKPAKCLIIILPKYSYLDKEQIVSEISNSIANGYDTLYEYWYAKLSEYEIEYTNFSTCLKTDADRER